MRQNSNIRKGFGRFLALFLYIVMVIMCGCATSQAPNAVDNETIVTAGAADNTSETRQHDSIDPFEQYNRAVFDFNMTLDRWLLKPVAVGYIAITPDAMETGIDNVFSNLNEVRDVFNDVLQWKWKAAGTDASRLVINSTVGIAGIFDVAKHAGLEETEREDFGQTLSGWGLPQGPYIVLPFLGSYTVAEAIGMPLDWELNPVSHLKSNTARYAIFSIDRTHLRSRFLETEELMSGDVYVFVRDAYMQRREYLVKDGLVEDDFGSGFNDGGEESFDF